MARIESSPGRLQQRLEALLVERRANPLDVETAVALAECSFRLGSAPQTRFPQAQEHLHRAFRLLHDFCAVQISALYGNAMKDRLYCEAPSAPLRRRTQTVMHRIVQGADGKMWFTELGSNKVGKLSR